MVSKQATAPRSTACTRSWSMLLPAVAAFALVTAPSAIAGPRVQGTGLSNPVSTTPNFHVVNAALYRSAEPVPGAYAEFRELGINTVLSVEDYGGNQDQADAERAQATAAGLKFLWVPMSGILKPTPAQIDEALSYIVDPANQPVLVHCQFGADRTGIVVASYRLRYDHWTRDAAVSEMYQYGHSPLLSWWDDVLNEEAAE